MKNRPSGSGVVAAGQTDGRRDVPKLMVKLGEVHPCTVTEALYRPYGP